MEDERIEYLRKRILIYKLRVLQDSKDHEMAHSEADELILSYIGDKEVTEAFNKITKWYA